MVTFIHSNEKRAKSPHSMKSKGNSKGHKSVDQFVLELHCHTMVNDDMKPLHEKEATCIMFFYAALANSISNLIYTDLPGKYPAHSFHTHQYIVEQVSLAWSPDGMISDCTTLLPKCWLLFWVIINNHYIISINICRTIYWNTHHPQILLYSM